MSAGNKTSQSKKALVTAAVSAGIVSRRQIVSAYQNSVSGSLKDFAKEIVQNQLLTRYQVQQLLAGNGPRLRLGRCSILRELGRGGMGVVYQARQDDLHRLVAIKVLPDDQTKDSDSLKRFYREARSAARLKHPNIVQVFDVSHENNRHFILMEYVDGTNLADLLKKRGHLGVGESLAIVRQAADGLSHAHQNGIVHRDIKPANLMLEGQALKILDLGLARHETDDQVTAENSILGTLDYMSPEQCQGGSNVDQQSDIYSLGCTLFCLLTGQPPFANRQPAGKLLAHVTEPLPDLSAAIGPSPDRLNSLIQRMTAKQKSARYSSMHDVIADLQSLIEQLDQQTVIVPAAELTGSETDQATLDASNAMTVQEGSATRASDVDEEAPVTDAGSSGRPNPAATLLLTLPVVGALVLAGVYIGIMAMIQKQQQATDNNSIAPAPRTANSVDDSGNQLTTPKVEVPTETSPMLPAVAKEESTTDDSPTAALQERSAIDRPPANSSVESAAKSSGFDTEISGTKTALSGLPESQPSEQASSKTSEMTNTIQPVIQRGPMERVLRSFESDWQADSVDGDALTLVSDDAYLLNAPVRQTVALTIQGTVNRRALVLLTADSASTYWHLDGTDLTFRHVDLVIDARNQPEATTVFDVDTCSLNFVDCSITILTREQATGPTTTLVGLIGAKPFDIRAGGTEPKPLAIRFTRTFIRGAATLVQNSSTHSIVSLAESIVSLSGPLFVASHRDTREFEYQSMVLESGDCILDTPASIVRIDCQPFDLRPVPMTVSLQRTSVLSSQPVARRPAVITWQTPIQRDLIADRLAFKGQSNRFDSRQVMLTTRASNGSIATIVQFPADWENQQLGQDLQSASGRPSINTLTSALVDRSPRDYRRLTYRFLPSIRVAEADADPTLLKTPRSLPTRMLRQIR